jgi:thymidylate synthase
METFDSVGNAILLSLDELRLYGDEVDTGHWQGVSTEGKPDLVTMEMMNLRWTAMMPWDFHDAQLQCDPNLPWAEDHFQERVSRVPSNPGEQYKNWPWWVGQVSAFDRHPAMGDEGAKPKFSHTYQERFWPKYAGSPYPSEGAHLGTRYKYGDLDDVVNLLRKHPFTRQATFPIFFPEDTGAVHGGRVPCTLHYHFLRRGDSLHLWYPMRSCDAVRHFRDDVYMAVRLCQWVLNELIWVSREDSWAGVKPGFLHFTAYSFHVHKGDLHCYERLEKRGSASHHPDR